MTLLWTAGAASLWRLFNFDFELALGRNPAPPLCPFAVYLDPALYAVSLCCLLFALFPGQPFWASCAVRNKGLSAQLFLKECFPIFSNSCLLVHVTATAVPVIPSNCQNTLSSLLHLHGKCKLVTLCQCHKPTIANR